MTSFQNTSKAVTVPSGRISRLARLGSMATGVAGNMALSGLRQVARGERPGFQDLLLTPGNVHRIANELARMRGAAMKIGQLLSMDTGDVLPPELSAIMARLRANADYMPPRQLKTVLTQAWGDGWLRKFKSFDVHPIAAASIGQVHRAMAHDGRDMAIKVQYPGVARSIDSDVANVGSLIKMTGLVPKGFDLAPYLTEARRQLHEETDYVREGQCLLEFRRLLAGSDAFELPELYEDHTTQNILAMSYVPSVPIEDAVSLDQARRNEITAHMIDLLLRELFDFGLMQTDPNYANYRFDPETGKIVLLDFGATRAFSDEVAEQYRRLMRAGIDGDRPGLHAAAQDIGFFAEATARRHQDAIVDMIALIFEEVLAEDEFDFASPSLNQKMNKAGIALSEDGFIPPLVPMDVLYLQRKFGGTFLLAGQLGARLPMRSVLEHWIQDRAGCAARTTEKSRC
ncbi:MAG: AarF/ABC1/UbiB kinase family protein [Pseudomonadota bacterium]